MTIKELIEYLQQEVAEGTPEDTELGRLQLMLPNKRVMSMGQRTMIMERGQAPVRVMRGESIPAKVAEMKLEKDEKVK
jgi:hypothetical protein